MLAMAQLCNAQQQQATSLLPFRKSQLTKVPTQPQQRGLRLPCSRSDTSSLVCVQRVSGSSVHAKNNILVWEPTNWEHSVSRKTIGRHENYLALPDIPAERVLGRDRSRSLSQPWTCANAPKYIAVKLEEMSETFSMGVHDLADAQELLIENLRLRDLAHSTIQSYYTAYGIQQICKLLGLDAVKCLMNTKVENISMLKSALIRKKPMPHNPRYNALQLAH